MSEEKRINEILEELEDLADERHWMFYNGISYNRTAFMYAVAIIKELLRYRKYVDLPRHSKQYILEKIKRIKDCIGGKEVD